LDTLFNKAIGIFSFASFGSAMVAADRLGGLAGPPVILDLVFRGNSSDLIIACSQDQTITVGQVIMALEPSVTSWILDPTPDLFNLLTAREIVDMKSTVVIFESNQIGAVLNLANEFFKLSWKTVDFKFLRSSESFGYVVLTSDFELPLEIMRSYSQSGKFSFIQKPTEILTNIFNINM
jgi:hypothetical protein